MQIVGKVRNATFASVCETLVDRVQQSVPLPLAGHVVVRPLFPGAASGRRAAMFIVDVPDDTSSNVVASLIAMLRGEESVEYAELPSDRRPV